MHGEMEDFDINILMMNQMSYNALKLYLTFENFMDNVTWFYKKKFRFTFPYPVNISGCCILYVYAVHI